MPLNGYNGNLAEDMINSYIAPAVATQQGLIVEPANNDVLSVANDWGYFLMEDVTLTGPTEFERVLGTHMWEVGVSRPVSILIPKDGAVVRTIHVAQGAGEPVLARDQVGSIVNGVFTTAAAAPVPKFKIVGLPADTGMAGYYDVKLYVQR
jgi:hypothetical protein